MIEIAKCPFCGAEGRHPEDVEEDYPFVWVTCTNDNCGALGPSREDPIKAIEAWNVRLP